jgi:hypothetical protein
MTAEREHHVPENACLGFVAQLPRRLAVIEQCWIDCYLAPHPLPSLHELVRQTGNLRNCAALFELAALAEVAAALETGLAPWAARGRIPDPDARARLDRLVAALHAASLDASRRHTQ